MIISLTLNPSIDLGTSVEVLLPEHKLRASPFTREGGGGGINVCKALTRLGVEAKAFLFSGGLTGTWLNSYLDSQGISYYAVPIRGQTRENMTINTSKNHKEYRLVSPGPTVSKKEELELFNALDKWKDQAKYIVLSGSLAPGISSGFIKNLSTWCRSASCRLVIDTSGIHLENALKHKPFLIKPNLRELGLLAGLNKIPNLNQARAISKQLVKDNRCEMVAVSMGAEGAMITNASEYLMIKSPKVPTLSTIGAGDSMVAGMVYMFAQNKSLKEALKMGVACGTATTMQKGTHLFKKQDVFRLFKLLS